MIRHASPALPIGALSQTMAESASLRLLVPAVGGVSLLAACSLSADLTAVAPTEILPKMGSFWTEIRLKFGQLDRDYADMFQQNTRVATRACLFSTEARLPAKQAH
jgi:hypothetical protein